MGEGVAQPVQLPWRHAAPELDKAPVQVARAAVRVVLVLRPGPRISVQPSRRRGWLLSVQGGAQQAAGGWLHALVRCSQSSTLMRHRSRRAARHLTGLRPAGLQGRPTSFGL